jgi:hypothetical protein
LIVWDEACNATRAPSSWEEGARLKRRGAQSLTGFRGCSIAPFRKALAFS